MADVLSIVQATNDARVAELMDAVTGLEAALAAEKTLTQTLRTDRDAWQRRAFCLARENTEEANGDLPWLAMKDAPRDRTPVLVRFRRDLYPGVEPEREDLARWNGRYAVVQHQGIHEDGFDPNWTIAAPVGVGGLPDKWLEGWLPVVAR